ncbi:MAG: hypothetical protein HY336_01360 [Candidatus Doudnabacteria bacterium]|nr:hypothetical protein [Candidatus Doudnabacteria bacterium]
MSDEIFDKESAEELSESVHRSDSSWKQFFHKNKKIIYASAGSLVVILLAALGWMIFSGQKPGVGPASNNVFVKIKGQSQVTSGNEGNYTVVYTNGEAADLTNVTLELFYPLNFKFISATPSPTNSEGQRFNLPTLKKGENAEVKIKGQLGGASGEIKEFKARLTYSLSNFNSEFVTEDSFTTLILPPNLSVEITGPIDVIGGQETTFSINYSNVSSQAFENLALIVAYPSGFKFASSVPPPSKNQNYWTVPKLDKGGLGKIEITGSFSASNAADAIVGVELGQITNNTFATLINSSAVFKTTPSSLSLTLTANPKDVVSLGDSIEYTLDYGNFGTIGLTNVVITASLQGTVLDLTRLNVRDAIVTGNVLTWKSATKSELNLVSPNQKGKITFSVPTKSSLTTNIKNQTIGASASIYAAEVPKPVHVPDVNLKLATQLGLSVSGRYVRGALPMKVGESTTFEITFILSNLSNDLENAQVVSSLLLPSSSWKNIIAPDSEKSRISFNPGAGKIIWKIPQVSAFVGKYAPALMASFELEVIPTEADRGKTVNLLKDIQATGKDLFIGKDVSSGNVIDINTANIDDDQLNLKGSAVQ